MLLRAVRHNGWANDQLIAFCERLAPEQLAWTVPGTYGSIHETLQHIVRGEEGYLFALNGDEVPPRGRVAAPDQGLVPLDELRDRARTSTERMERYIASGDDPSRRIPRPNGEVYAAGIAAAQFIHHGSDHRAHIGTILGAHGVDGPEIDVWMYALANGELVEPKE
jgi:uncharacterized damage-inducible protein DinB